MRNISTRIARTLLLALLAVPTMIFADTTLWYDQPARCWTEALPLGNGRLGAMVYGGIKSDTIQINEASFWTGAPYAKAERGSRGMSYESVGNVVLTFPTHTVERNYRRELNVDEAVARTSYNAGGVDYDREVLTSFADDVTVIRVRSSKKGALSFTVDFCAPGNKSRVNCNVSRTEGVQDELRVFSYHATPDKDGVANALHCTTLVKVLNVDGRCTASSSRITVSEATEALVVVSSATNYVNHRDITGDSEQSARITLNKFLAKGNALQKFGTVVNDHKNLYQKQYNRVKLAIGGNSLDEKNTTDRRIMSFAYSDDSRLVADFLQFGRYLLICSSQKNGPAANAQGLWNSGMTPYGDPEYDLAESLPMTYWAAMAANMPESNQPYLRLIQQIAERGTRTAAAQGTRGWATARNTDLWCADTDAGNVAYNASLASVLWEEYLYTGDRRYLSSVAFPVMAEASRYYLDRDAAEYTSVSVNNQMIYDLFCNTRQAAETIASSMWGQAAADLMALADSLDEARMKLLPMAVDGNGQLSQTPSQPSPQEYKASPLTNLWCAYPGRQMSVYRHPELASAVRMSLLEKGDGGNSMQMAWKACMWARLLDGDHAYRMILNMLSIKDAVAEQEYGRQGGVYPNMVCGNPSFAIAGNLGCVAAMAEMLVQSHDGAVHLLPALPTAWADGEVTGLLCRGGYEIVKMKWTNGTVQSVTIRSTVGGPLRLRSNAPLRMSSGRDLAEAADGPCDNGLLRVYDILTPTVQDPSRLNDPELEETYLYDIPTNPGTEYTFVRY